MENDIDKRIELTAHIERLVRLRDSLRKRISTDRPVDETTMSKRFGMRFRYAEDMANHAAAYAIGRLVCEAVAELWDLEKYSSLDLRVGLPRKSWLSQFGPDKEAWRHSRRFNEYRDLLSKSIPLIWPLAGPACEHDEECYCNESQNRHDFYERMVKLTNP